MLISGTTKQEAITGYTAYYKLKDKNEGDIRYIEDNLIQTEEIAELRAKAEFLENGGYKKQYVEFTTYFIDLKINSIIKVNAPTYRIPSNLNHDRFIVKEIKHYIKQGAVLTKIKAIRYD